MVPSLEKPSFNIDKRFSDFINLMKELTTENKNVTYPELPTRYHLMKEDLDKRGRDLEEFLSIQIVNISAHKGYLLLEEYGDIQMWLSLARITQMLKNY